MSKQMSLVEIFSDNMLEKAVQYNTASELCEHVVKPNLKEINKRTKQENDPMYLAYLLEYSISELKKSKRYIK